MVCLPVFITNVKSCLSMAANVLRIYEVRLNENFKL